MDDVQHLAAAPQSATAQVPGWYGMWCVIATEAALFAYLLFSYFYLAAQSHGGWLPELPRWRLAAPNTVLLIASSATLHWGQRCGRAGNTARLSAGLLATLLLGALFIGVQLREWHNKPFSIADHAYASSYFVTTGFHLAHVVLGLVVIATLLLWASLGKLRGAQQDIVAIGTLYWHFVDVVWLAVFATFYVSPYLR
jgi:cytochrome c oxidase subunit 3